MSKAYEIGFDHGYSGRGTHGYKPGNRKPGGANFKAYGAGFQVGMAQKHDETLSLRQRLAYWNTPRETRGSTK